MPYPFFPVSAEFTPINRSRVGIGQLTYFSLYNSLEISFGWEPTKDSPVCFYGIFNPFFEMQIGVTFLSRFHRRMKV